MSDRAFDLTYLSLGAGVQSTALYILSALGERGVPATDVDVFADTGDEPPHVYRQLEALEAWGLVNGGARIQRVSIGQSTASRDQLYRRDDGTIRPPLVPAAARGPLRRPARAVGRGV